MKKYVKPELLYERFELAQHIADCVWELNNASKESCAAEGDPKFWGSGYTETLFTATASCTIDSSDYQDYCYQSGADGMNVFKS